MTGVDSFRAISGAFFICMSMQPPTQWNVRRHDTRSHKRNAGRGSKPLEMASLLMAGDRRVCGLSAKKRYIPRSPNQCAGMIEMLPVATGASPKNHAILVNREGNDGMPPSWTGFHGEGDCLLHELLVAGRTIGGHQARPWSLALSASFSQTIPAMMTASQNAWPSVSGWSSRMLPKTAAPTEPMPAHTA